MIVCGFAERTVTKNEYSYCSWSFFCFCVGYYHCVYFLSTADKSTSLEHFPARRIDPLLFSLPGGLSRQREKCLSDRGEDRYPERRVYAHLLLEGKVQGGQQGRVIKQPLTLHRGLY